MSGEAALCFQNGVLSGGGASLTFIVEGAKWDHGIKGHPPPDPFFGIIVMTSTY